MCTVHNHLWKEVNYEPNKRVKKKVDSILDFFFFLELIIHFIHRSLMLLYKWCSWRWISVFADPIVSVFPTELRDGGDGLGAVHGHSAAGEFIH